MGSQVSNFCVLVDRDDDPVGTHDDYCVSVFPDVQAFEGSVLDRPLAEVVDDATSLGDDEAVIEGGLNSGQPYPSLAGSYSGVL